MLFTNWNVNAKRNKVPNAPICWNSEQLGNKISLDRQGKFLRKRKFYIFWTWHALTQVSLILGLTQNLIWSRTAEFYLEFPNGINEKTKALVIGATMLVVSLYLMWRKWIVSKNKYLKYLHSWIYDTNEKCII